MFPISKCRGDRDLGLCTTSGLALENRSAMTNSNFSCVETRFFSGIRHRVAVLHAQVPKLCTDLDLSLLYILILGTYSKFARKNNFLSLGVCFPQLSVSRSTLVLRASQFRYISRFKGSWTDQNSAMRGCRGWQGAGYKTFAH